VLAARLKSTSTGPTSTLRWKRCWPSFMTSSAKGNDVTFSVHGLAVSRGIAIGRAVLVASSRADVAHYFIDASKADEEITRLRVARDAVGEEITRLQQDLPEDAPHEIAALLDVHLMLLQDELLISGVKHWITER